MTEKSFFWDKIAAKYDKQVSGYTAAYEKTIERSRKYCSENDLLLDFACGTGITTLHLAPRVKEVHAVDISRKMIGAAQEKTEKAGLKNVRFYHAGIFDNRFIPGTYDVITAFNVLLFIKNLPGVFARIHDLLKPGGMLLSATDCLGEKKTAVHVLQHMLGKAGLFPYTGLLTMDSLETAVSRYGFTVRETENLHGSPPNYFIAAVKNSAD